MFGTHDGYEGFPKRSKSYLDDLMSLNTLDPKENGSRKGPVKSDSRSLRTDDIEGAKPKTGLRKNTDTNAYSGLNLPSYSSSSAQGKAPMRSQQKSSDYSKNVANFYGLTPPGSPRSYPQEKFEPVNDFNPEPNYEKNPSKKDFANFYGVTPPRSRAADPIMNPVYNNQNYNNTEINAKDLANFYGATPPVSRPGPNEEYVNNYAKPPRVQKEQRNPITHNLVSYNGNDVPSKAVAGFYGATPPVSRPGVNDRDLGNVAIKQGVSNKDLANFYGVTPPPTGKPIYQQSYPEHQGPYAKDPTYSYDPAAPTQGYQQNYPNDYKQSENINLSNKNLANFYGVTPPPTGKPVYQQSYPDNRGLYTKDPTYSYEPPNPAPGYQQNYSKDPRMAEKVQLSNKDLANFYGVTPPPTGKPVYQQGYSENKPGYTKDVNYNYDPSGGNPVYQQNYPREQRINEGVQLSNKDLANFYGVTPPPTGKPGNYAYGANVNTGNQLNPKDFANFYGVTPPPTGKLVGNDYGYSGNNVGGKDLANFYGVTPPPSGGQFGSNNRVYGNEVVEPEFQYAAEMAGKVNAPQQKYGSDNVRKGYNQVSTASRIFN